MGPPPARSSEPERSPSELRISPDFALLETVRRFVASEMSDEPDGDELYLVAVNEVVTNAIESHRRTGTEEPIGILADSGSRTVVVTDCGDGYAPMDDPEIGHLGPSGRGLVIAATMFPDLSWRPNHPRGTIFTLPFPDTFPAGD